MNKTQIIERVKKAGLFIIPKGCGPMWKFYKANDKGIWATKHEELICVFFEFCDFNKSWGTI